MFNFLREKISKIYTQFSSKLFSIFSKKIDECAITELNKILLEADAGVKITNSIIAEVESKFKSGDLKDGMQLKDLLESSLLKIASSKTADIDSRVFLMIGINGSGKTTFVSKLANFYKKQGNSVLMVAADTFRAAAVDQLKEWAYKTESEIVIGSQGQDPASVVFTGAQRFKENKFDILIIDTAGRLQTKSHLMQELSKIKKVIQKNLPDEKITTLLTIDSMLGQNSFEQAKIFNESTDVSGLVLTKLDGTGKGGIIFRIIDELQIPVAFVSYGENLEAMEVFDAVSFIKKLLEG